MGVCKVSDEQSAQRPISTIAADIKRLWGTKVYFGAKPYIDAMLCMSTREDMYGADSADDIILRFLGNASAFRGEKAKTLKLELAHHLSPAYRAQNVKKYQTKPAKPQR